MRPSSIAPASLETFVRKSALRKPRIPTAALHLLGILGVLLMVAAIPIWTIVGTWADHQAMMRDWRSIVGPACPIPTAAWPGNGRRPKVFRYKGVRFERRYGAVYCEAVTDGMFKKLTHPVCQFTAPGLLTVTTARGTVTWQPAIGRNATVTIRDGRASCAVGGWWR